MNCAVHGHYCLRKLVGSKQKGGIRVSSVFILFSADRSLKMGSKSYQTSARSIISKVIPQLNKDFIIKAVKWQTEVKYFSAVSNGILL